MSKSNACHGTWLARARFLSLLLRLSAAFSFTCLCQTNNDDGDDGDEEGSKEVSTPRLNALKTLSSSSLSLYR